MPACAHLSRFRLLLATSAMVLAGIAQTFNVAVAGTILWGTPQSITGDSDVSTVGTLLYAYNFGSTSVTDATVNGVTFVAFGIAGGKTQSKDAVTISENPYFLYWGGWDSTSNPFAALSSSYRNLLGTNVTATSPDTITLELGGLTPGRMYDFQWWSNRSSSPVYSTTASAGNSVTLSSNTNTGDLEGGLGQFVIGRFTASGTSQSIDFSGGYEFGTSDMPAINGFQVRVVPEPSTWAMLGTMLALGGPRLLLRRRRLAP